MLGMNIKLKLIQMSSKFLFFPCYFCKNQYSLSNTSLTEEKISIRGFQIYFLIRIKFGMTGL
jgi:hypothetical protein